MKLRHDPEADALSIALRPDLAYDVSIELDHRRIVDFGYEPGAERAVPISIELLAVSRGVDVRGLPEEGAVAELLRAHGIRITHSSAEVA